MKPHAVHPNHLFGIGEELFVTRFQQRDAISLFDASRCIDVSVGAPHDGVPMHGRIYFTTDNGFKSPEPNASKTWVLNDTLHPQHRRAVLQRLVGRPKGLYKSRGPSVNPHLRTDERKTLTSRYTGVATAMSIALMESRDALEGACPVRRGRETVYRALYLTLLPMAKGFVYLVAVMDWYSRRVLSWRVSTTMDSNFYIEALNEAIGKFGCPEIFNTDQGSQFTSEEFTGMIKNNYIRISMDGKGCWVDNVSVERLWRSVKYEEVYLKAYGSVAEARRSLKAYFELYNHERRHQSLDNETPDFVHK